MRLRLNFENFRDKRDARDDNSFLNKNVTNKNIRKILKQNLSKCSLFLFTYDNVFRLKMVDIVTSLNCILFINLINIISSVFLILETNESLLELNGIVSKICILIYFIEFLLKIIAFGFIILKKAQISNTFEATFSEVDLSEVLLLQTVVTALLFFLFRSLSE